MDGELDGRRDNRGDRKQRRRAAYSRWPPWRTPAIRPASRPPRTRELQAMWDAWNVWQRAAIVGQSSPEPNRCGTGRRGRAPHQNPMISPELTEQPVARLPGTLPSSSVAAVAIGAPPQLVSLRTIGTQGGETFHWHAHSFEEFTLVTDDRCMIGYPTGWAATASNTLIHYRAGEQHGAAAAPGQRPKFWVIHFAGVPKHFNGLPALAASDPAKRVWSLTPEQSAMFQWLFLQLLNERSAARARRGSRRTSRSGARSTRALSRAAA